MTVTNINNNNAAQLQLYGQQKSASSTERVQQSDVTDTQPTANASSDSVQISAQAKALLASETQGNGGGIIPPGTAPETGNKGQVSTQGNGGGIIPPGTVDVGNATPGATTLGNGGGIIPPGN